MASCRSAPSEPRRSEYTVEQKLGHIVRLKSRIEQLNGFDPQRVQKRFDEPEVLALQTAVADTLSAVFGPGTPEYNRYSDAARLDQGPVFAGMDFGGRGH